MLACLALGCASEEATAPGSSADPGSASPTAVGAGTVTGDTGFDVVTARFHDPGPFNGKSRVEIALSTDAACARPRTCSQYTELVLKLSADSEISPGSYELINPQEGAGSLIVEWVTVENDRGSCRVGGQPATRGTVSLRAVGTSELKGDFDLQLLSVGGTDPVITGEFTALQCP